VLSAVFELVIVETTGVGQSETDVEHVADTVVLVIQPASGDVLQFLKSGILEIPDLFAVNKFDLGPLAARTAAELEAALSALHAAARSGPRPAVIHTSATSGAGIVALADAIEEQRAALESAGLFAERRSEKSALWALRLFQQRFGEAGVEAAGGEAALQARLLEAIRSGAAAVEAVAAVCPE
jgi:LAO/AO transport system kinase